MSPLGKNMIKGFNNVNCVFSNGVKKGSINWNDGFISSFDSIDGNPTLKDGVYVAPGFIDEHIHGANGADVMDASISSLNKIADSLLQEGVTSFLATTMTEATASIEKALLNVNEYRKAARSGARVIGVHLEGPFISSAYKGAQPLEFIRVPNASELDRFVSLSGESIRLVTFAYENDKDGAFLSYCVKKGITPSLGHSSCSGELAFKGYKKGIKCVTHLYNAQKGFHHRDVGITGSALLTDGVKTELIADLHHSCKEAVEMVFRLKKKEDIILISDSTEAKYLEEGSKAKLGSQDIYVKGGVAVLSNGVIAGSILRLDDALRNVKPLARQYSYSDLINLVALNPAKNIGLDNEIGSLSVGHRADFALLDDDFHVLAVIKDGNLVFGSIGNLIKE